METENAHLRTALAAAMPVPSSGMWEICIISNPVSLSGRRGSVKLFGIEPCLPLLTFADFTKFISNEKDFDRISKAYRNAILGYQ